MDEEEADEEAWEKEDDEEDEIYINTRLLNDQVDCVAGFNFFSNGLV